MWVQPDGTDRTCNRLGGTANNQGGYARGSANVYRMGVNLGGMATVLPALAGTPVSYGSLRGTNWENYIQEMADQLGAQQIDGGCARGGWIYGITTALPAVTQAMRPHPSGLILDSKVQRLPAVLTVFSSTTDTSTALRTTSSIINGAMAVQDTGPPLAAEISS